MLSPKTAALLLATFVGASQATITACPTTETQVTTTDGSIYAVCKQTDYQGETTRLVTPVASELDCAQLCNGQQGCTNAVFDSSHKVCHLKGPASNLDWVQDNQYTTIRFVNKPAQYSTITACPTTETNIIYGGVVLAICANSDYEGETATAIPNISSPTACAQACAKIAACTRSVYQAQSSQCFIKNSDPSKLRWEYNTASSSVRVVSALAQGSTLTSCPSAPGASTLTTSKGAKFSACINGDYQADSVDILGGVTSAAACAEICGARTTCSYASWDSANTACHIKPTIPAPTFVYNRGFTSLKRTSAIRGRRWY